MPHCVAYNKGNGSKCKNNRVSSSNKYCNIHQKENNRTSQPLECRPLFQTNRPTSFNHEGKTYIVSAPITKKK